MSPELWTIIAAGGIITGPMVLLLGAMRMMFNGSLVSRQYMVDRLEDKQQIIDGKDRVISEQSGYIDTLEGQVDLLSRGNRTTLQVVEALPQITSPNRSGTS